MSRKTTTFATLAALVGAAILLPAPESVRAENEPRAAATARPPARLQPGPRLLAAPAPAPEFIAAPVIQPLPEPEPEAAPEDAPSDTPTSLAALVAGLAPPQALNAELRCLASAVYFEARGEPLEGQLAVAQVIVNRSRDPRFAPGYCGVVRQPGQFSFLRAGRIPAVRQASRAWARAQAIARVAHEGLWPSAVGDAVFFHATYVRPAWSYAKTRLARIDTHIFYR